MLRAARRSSRRCGASWSATGSPLRQCVLWRLKPVCRRGRCATTSPARRPCSPPRHTHSWSGSANGSFVGSRAATSWNSYLARETHKGLRRLAEHVLTEITGGTLAGSAMTREVDALVALLDGFELHLSIYPQRGQASRVRAALGEHLDAVRARSKASAGRDVPLQLGQPGSGGGV